MRLEARPKSAEGAEETEISIQRLCINALRQRPDRIIVGEVRDGCAREMIYEAMGTGHPRSLCTIHADNPRKTLTRLESRIRMNASHERMPGNVIQQISPRRSRSSFRCVAQDPASGTFPM